MEIIFLIFFLIKFHLTAALHSLALTLFLFVGCWFILPCVARRMMWMKDNRSLIALAMGGQSIRDKPSKPDAIDLASTVHGDGNGPSQPNAEEQKK